MNRIDARKSMQIYSAKKDTLIHFHLQNLSAMAKAYQV